MAQRSPQIGVDLQLVERQLAFAAEACDADTAGVHGQRQRVQRQCVDFDLALQILAETVFDGAAQ